jgi:hypothetical protein
LRIPHLKNKKRKEISLVSVGTVTMKIYDGVVRSLEVWHVPELRKNPIC